MARLQYATWSNPSRPSLWRRNNDLLIRVGTTTTTTCNTGHLHTGVTTNLYNCVGNGFTSWHANGTRNAYFADTQKCSSTSSYSASGYLYTGDNLPCIADPNEIAYVNSGKRICYWEQNAFTSFNKTTWAATANYTANLTPISGPNLNCPVSILPLSSNRKQVLDKLNEMYPAPGGTMSDVGMLWGLRTLSPNWTTFWGLSATQAPGAFNSNSVYKIAIVLTDGYNEAPTQYEGYYGCTDTGRGGRAQNCWQSPNVAALNNTTAQNLDVSACNQMRTKYGVDLYFILVDVTDATALANAQQCAPDPGHAISTTSGNLQSVFNNLVSHSLRLTH